MKFKDGIEMIFPYNVLSQVDGIKGEIGEESSRYTSVDENGNDKLFISVVFPPLYVEVANIPSEYLEEVYNG